MEFLTMIWDFIISNWHIIITTGVTVATVIVKITPNTTDNKYLEIFIKIFEVLGGNTPPVNSEDAKLKKAKKAAWWNRYLTKTS